MYLSKTTALFCFIVIVLLIGCSSNNSAVMPDTSGNMNNDAPLVNMSDADLYSSNVGIMGAYELSLNLEEMTGELIPKRVSAIGESYIVEGISYFTLIPCGDCFKIEAIYGDSSGVAVQFGLQHPFAPANHADPQSAKNRDDLDVFDVALVIAPIEEDNEKYSRTDIYVYNNICFNQDGYTTELANLAIDDTAMPYFLVVDDSETGINPFNKFGMGASESFTAYFKPRAALLNFNLYITMAYGSSATWETRFTPKYYNPEFNRKAAWKIDVFYEDSWTRNDTTTPVDVQVSVYDWQIGVPVATAPDFADANTDRIYAASDVASVSVEIPGMNSTLQVETVPTSGTGTPSDPLIYTFSIANENGIYEDNYIGLVAVTDSRQVSAIPPTGNRDFLISCPDGIMLDYLELPQFVTYQTFDVTVYGDCTGYCWTRTWGGPDWDSARSIAVDNQGNLYVVGVFYENAIFNPNGGVYQESNGKSDVYLSKFNSYGDWKWTRTWGGENYDQSEAVGVTSTGLIYVLGHFYYTAEFNPDGGGEQTSMGNKDIFLSKFDGNGNWLGTVVWGGTSWDIPYDLAIGPNDEIYVTGLFAETSNFNPFGSTVLTSNGESDCFLSKLDTSGNLEWVKSWGGPLEDSPLSVDTAMGGDVFVTGYFNGTAEFDPGGGNAILSKGAEDSFLSRFDSSGTWQHTRTWGGPEQDIPTSCAVDGLGNIHVTGYFIGTSEFNPAGGSFMTAAGNRGCFLTKFNSSTAWQWAFEWGGPSWDLAWEVTTDSYDNVYVVGDFRDSADFDPGSPIVEKTAIGIDDCFLTKFDSAGNWEWAKTWGGEEQDDATCVFVDSSDSIYVSGHFNTSGMFNPDGGNFIFGKGGGDTFLSKFNY